MWNTEFLVPYNFVSDYCLIFKLVDDDDDDDDEHFINKVVR